MALDGRRYGIVHANFPLAGGQWTHLDIGASCFTQTAIDDQSCIGGIVRCWRDDRDEQTFANRGLAFA